MIGIGISPMFQDGAVGNLDVNAKMFLDAAGIIDNTQKVAVNNFVKDLKAINAVQPDFVNFDIPENSICQAIYPFVGGTAAKHKFNLINPVDTDAARRLAYTGTPIHDEKGVKGDGVSASINTFVNFSALNSYGLDLLFNGGDQGANKMAFGNGGGQLYMIIGGSLNVSSANDVVSNGKSINDIRKNKFNTSGLINVNRRSQALMDGEVYYGPVKVTSTSNATVTPDNSTVRLLSNGTGGYCSTSLISFAAIRKVGVSELVVKLFQSAILKYQNALGRLQKINLVFEGHSFFHNQPGGGATDWLVEQTVIKLNNTYATRIYSYVASAVLSSYVDDLISRKATSVDPYIISDYGIKNIIPLWIGTNDIFNGPNNNGTILGSGLIAYNKLKIYYNSLLANGWTPIVFTMTQCNAGLGAQESERVIFNNLIRNDLTPTYLIDAANQVELVDSTDLIYFNLDKIHLTKLANLILSTMLQNIISVI